MTTPLYYMPLQPGDTATQALLDLREPPSAVKTANQSVNNTTTNVTDNHLTVALAANAMYHVSCIVAFSGPAAANWKQLWTFPSGATGQRFSHGPGTGVTSVRSTQLHVRAASLATSLGYGTDGIETSLLNEDILLTTAGTSGSLTLTWAQLTATAGVTTVYAGSWIRAERVV
ncbi:hypothetical protein [Glycomyces artemisiae]|uniref:Uncharacterized protein n=1 Tax=Glycomyces artemisiae TaxID=1076443 RepID=A0A2T0UEV7_9ACTN|nr:hypothetical protein [Glycomyces artemisiae]PRY56432.1 hypothetical protein B0I28_10981 [Glycomyces artemisiae]